MKNLEMRYFFVALLSGLALAALPQAGRAQGYDGLTVGGVEVTANNASNITGQNIQGTVSYDADSNTLTLNQAVIMNSTGIVAPGNLTVAVIGEGNVVNGSITSTGGNDTLTFKNGDDNSASLQYLPSFSGGATGFTNVVYDGIYLTAGNSRDLKYSPTRQRYEINEYSSSSEVNLSSEKTYELWVGDIKVTEANRKNILSAATATASFNPETSTLTLNGVSLTNTSISDAGIISRLDELTISVSGSNTITIVDTCTAIRADREGSQTLTIVAEGATDKLVLAGSRAIRNFSSLTLTNLTWDGDYEYGLLDLGYEQVYALYTYEAEESEVGNATLSYQLDYGLRLYTEEDEEETTEWKVTNDNAADVLGDGTVSYDAEQHILTLNNASFGSSSGALWVEGTPDLTINLIGENIMRSAETFIFMNTAGEAAPTLTFTTSEQEPGTLLFEHFYGEGMYEEMLFGEISPVFEAGLALSNMGEYYIIGQFDAYPVWVNGTQVTELNYHDVLFDDGSVTYAPATAMLTLNNAYVMGNIRLGTGGPTTLTVMLKGENSFGGQFVTDITAVTPSLVFVTDPNSPGSMVLRGNYTLQNFYDGFSVSYENGLHADTDASGLSSISTFAVIDPIVDDDVPDRTIDIDNTSGEYDDLDGVVINDVYYTLSSEQGGFDGDGVAIRYGMTDEEVENVVSSNKPGDAGFEAFRGITLMVPAGIGSVTIRAKSDNGGILKVKVGNAPAMAAPLPDEYGNIVINYECAEPTYIYLYASDSDLTAARGVGIHRGKVLTGVVKVKGYSASSAAVCSTVGGNNTATVYSLSCLGYTAGDTSVSMSEVSVPASSSSSVVSAARGPRKTDGSTVTYKVTALGDNVFDLITDKEIIRYIDLSGTEINGLTVNRSAGVFDGFGKNTLIYLPDGNNDGNELNVIVGNTCQKFTLSDNRPFRAPSGTFTAAKIQLERDFTPSQTSTLMLPFTIPAAQADDMGTFHSFKEIKDGNAVFEKVNGDIQANVPYIFVPKKSRVEAESVTVSGSDAVEANQGELWGTYERIDWDGSQTNIYGFAAAADEGHDIAAGEFVRLASGAWTLPFRAYIKTTTTEPSRLRLVIDGEQQTGIAVVGGQEAASGSWFTLDGRRLDGRPTQQGLYINNGVKVIVK